MFAIKIQQPAVFNSRITKRFSKSCAGKYNETVRVPFYLIYTVMWKIKPQFFLRAGAFTASKPGKYLWHSPCLLDGIQLKNRG